MTHAKRFLRYLGPLAVAGLLAGCPLGDDTDEPRAEETAEQAAAEPAPASKPASKPAPEPVCADCGRVTAIDKVTVEGESSGAGAVGGAIVGVVAGNQIGSGSGKDIAKIVGGIGGAIAGNEAETRLRAKTYYEVSVAMESGGTQVVQVADASMLTVGDEVRVQGNNLVLR